MWQEELFPLILLFTSTMCGREMGAGGGKCRRPVLSHIVTEAFFLRELCVNTAHLREKRGGSGGVSCFLYRIGWSSLHCSDHVDPRTPCGDSYFCPRRPLLRHRGAEQPIVFSQRTAASPETQGFSGKLPTRREGLLGFPAKERRIRVESSCST